MVQDCPICLQPISSPWGVSTPCGHPYHKECWDQFLASKGEEVVCALCNTPSTNFVLVYMTIDDDDKVKPQDHQLVERKHSQHCSFTRFNPTLGGFQPIVANGLGEVTSIMIDPFCITPGLRKKAMFTIMPSDTPAIYSSPADLVTVTVDDMGRLSFIWNEAVSSTTSSGGIRIGIPAHKLTSVSLKRGVKAQILDGFTSVRTLSLSGASSLKAQFTSSTVSTISMHSSGASKVNLSSNVKTRVDISGASNVSVLAPTVERVHLSGASFLAVLGNVGVEAMGSDSAKVSGCSTLSVTGRIIGSISISGMSNVRAWAFSGGYIHSTGMSNYCLSDDVETVDVSEDFHIN